MDTRSYLTAFIACMSVASAASAAINLTPGTLLVQRDGVRDIFQLNPSTGAAIGQLSIAGSQFNIAGSMVVIDNRLYVTDVRAGSYIAFRADPTTGAQIGDSFTLPPGGGGLRRHGVTMDFGGGSVSRGLYDPATWSQVRGRVDMDYLALPAPFNLPRYGYGGWNGSGYTISFDEQLEPGTCSLIRFGPLGEALPNPVIATFQRPANTILTSMDIDEYSGDIWLHFRNNNVLGQTNYLAKYNPATPGPLQFIPVPYDINYISVVPIPAPGATSVVSLALVFAARRRRRV